MTYWCIWIETSNELQDDDSYSHISVFQEIGQYVPQLTSVTAYTE